MDILEDSIDRAPLSVERLRTHVDFVVEIYNTEKDGVRISRIGNKLESGDCVMLCLQTATTTTQTLTRQHEDAENVPPEAEFANLRIQC